MNKDYLMLIGLGILGLMVRMFIPGKVKGEVLRLKLRVISVYIMILLGILGLLLLIIDLF